LAVTANLIGLGVCGVFAIVSLKSRKIGRTRKPFTFPVGVLAGRNGQAFALGAALVAGDADCLTIHSAANVICAKARSTLSGLLARFPYGEEGQGAIVCRILPLIADCIGVRAIDNGRPLFRERGVGGRSAVSAIDKALRILWRGRILEKLTRVTLLTSSESSENNDQSRASDISSCHAFFLLCVPNESPATATLFCSLGSNHFNEFFDVMPSATTFFTKNISKIQAFKDK
jgi:hypothetical protein